VSATPFTPAQAMSGVPPHIAAEWARCRPWLEAALEHDGGHYGIEDVWREVAAGSATFWPGRRAAVITQFWNFPRARTCNHWLAGGDMAELLGEMQPAIDDWARANGCTEMTIAGRPGWVRAMKPFGFEPIFTVIRKRL
jgi:hypothetical protein